MVAALDDRAETLPDGPVTPEDEADAILACCWRYGSYAHVLTAGELYPPFRDNRGLSRIDDSEMQRINLEFSSGLAAWLAQRESDLSLIRKRVRAALLELPMPWRIDRETTVGDVDVGPLESRLERLSRDSTMPEPWSERLTIREEANHVVVWAYRNGPIEAIHAGSWSHGGELPGFKRLYASEVVQVGRFATRTLAWHLATRDQLSPRTRDLVLRAHTFGSADRWSVTDETSQVSFAGLPGVGPLGARLAWLGARWPEAYGGLGDD